MPDALCRLRAAAAAMLAYYAAAGADYALRFRCHARYAYAMLLSPLITPSLRFDTLLRQRSHAFAMPMPFYADYFAAASAAAAAPRRRR